MNLLLQPLFSSSSFTNYLLYLNSISSVLISLFYSVSHLFHVSYGADDLNDDPIQSPSGSPFGSPTSSCSSPSAVEDPELGFRIDLDWTAGDSEDQVALRLESQLMVALSAPHDTVVVELKVIGDGDEGCGENVGPEMRVEKRREPLH